MERFDPTRLILVAAVAGAITLVSACTQPPPAAVTPPPPPVVRIPPRPMPPMGAPADLTIPPLQANGTRITINSNLTGTQAVWTLRSAYNVAALNCRKPEHEALLPGYSGFLKNHAKMLKAVNSDLDRKFKASHGSNFIKVRETYQTQIYNFFALPPVLPAFCDTALALSQEMLTVAPDQLEGFAPAAVTRLDAVFQQFYNSFDQYKADLAVWEERYGAGPAVASGSPSSQSFAQ